MKRKINIVHRYPRLFIAVGTISSLWLLYGRLINDMFFRSYTQEEILAYEVRKGEIKEQVRLMQLRKQN